MSVFLLWEDRAAGPVTRFGPHVFLVACVASRIGMDRYELAIDGKSCAGNGRVLRELQREPLWNSGVHVVAVLDTDRLHDRLTEITSRGTVRDTDYLRWSDAVATEVRKHAPDHGQAQLDVCLLDRNLETLLAIIGRDVRELDEALGEEPPRPRQDPATRRWRREHDRAGVHRDAELGTSGGDRGAADESRCGLRPPANPSHSFALSGVRPDLG